MLKWSALWILLFSCGMNASAQSVQNYVKVDTLRVGDVIDYSLVLQKPQQYDAVIFPDTTHFGSAFEILEMRRFQISDFRDSVYYKLQFFGTQDGIIPNVPVRLVDGNDTLFALAETAPYAFRSYLPEEEQNLEFQPLKPIFTFARSIWPWLIGLLALALLSWFAYRWYKKRKEKSEKTEPAPEPPPFISPLEVLHSTIIQLRKDGDALAAGDFKILYSRLSDGVRAYFEEVYKLSALEQTTREVLRDLDANLVDQRLIDLTKTILRQADRVKFAKYLPTVDQFYSDVEIGERFVDAARSVDRGKIERLRKEHQAKFNPELVEESAL